MTWIMEDIQKPGWKRKAGSKKMKEVTLEVEELEERIAPDFITCTLGNGHSRVEVTFTFDGATSISLANPGHTHDMPLHSHFGLSQAC